MTDPNDPTRPGDPADPADSPDDADLDPRSRRLAELLRDLADDPAAPPSSVTPLAVIAAARRAAAGPARDGTAASDTHGPSAPAATPWFRRTRLLIGAAVAASVVAIAAIVIPIAARSGPSTTAGSAADNLDSAAVSAAAPAAGSDQRATSGDSAAAELAQPSSAASSAASAAPTSAAGGGRSGDASAGGGAAPPTGSAAQESAAGAAPDADTCDWPLLDDGAARAAVAAFPAGRVTGSATAEGPCAGDRVGAATFVDEQGSGDVVVLVSRAGVAACTLEAPAAAGPCALASDGTYRVPAGPDGAQRVYVYGDGYQVGGRHGRHGLQRRRVGRGGRGGAGRARLIRRQAAHRVPARQAAVLGSSAMRPRISPMVAAGDSAARSGEFSWSVSIAARSRTLMLHCWDCQRSSANASCSSMA